MRITQVVVNARYWYSNGPKYEGQLYVTDGTNTSSEHTWSSTSNFGDVTFNVSAWKSNSIKIATTSGQRVIISSISITAEIDQGYLDAVAFENSYILAPKGNLIEYPVASGPTGIDGTDCIDEGYYNDAVDAYDLLSGSAKEYFATHNNFAKARERFAAWALKATGKTLSFDSENGYDIVLNARFPYLRTISNVSGNLSAIVIIVSVIGLTTIGGYFLLRKKKEER